MTIGGVLRNYRQERHITVDEAARAMNMNAGSVSRIERNNSNPLTLNTYKIAKFMGISVDELLKMAGIEDDA